MTEKKPVRWVLWPEPGQFRGEGTWTLYKGNDADWYDMQQTGFLPTHEGDTPPEQEPS